MFVYQEYTDIRLAFTPPVAIGKFGGETDNWMWPRHTGDFSVFRVYSDSTGKPAKWGQMAIREFLLPLSFTIPFYVVGAVFSFGNSTSISVIGLAIIYVGIFATQVTDAVWIFRGSAKNRLVDLIAKTDVLNESP